MPLRGGVWLDTAGIQAGGSRRWKPRNLIADGAELARLLHALQAADAIGLIGTLVKFDPHGAALITGLAVGAAVGMVDHAKEAELIKERVYGAQWAGSSAKGTPAQHHPDQKQH